ncbi:MAG TPA: hypothetical protein VGT03_02270 [Candidatus Acidoferrales bacterium]|nr:hypothetical protein [Candidatus Acidoferrales bacterium]
MTRHHFDTIVVPMSGEAASKVLAASLVIAAAELLNLRILDQEQR